MTKFVFNKDKARDKLPENVIDAVGRMVHSRKFDAVFIRSIGIDHPRGVLVYGANETKKMEWATAIASLISETNPTVMNLPEFIKPGEGFDAAIHVPFNCASDDHIANGDNSKFYVYIVTNIDSFAYHDNPKTKFEQRSRSYHAMMEIFANAENLNNIFIIATATDKAVLPEAWCNAGHLEAHFDVDK